MGRAMAAVFAGDGERVVILGRREEVLVRAVEEIGAGGRGEIAWRRCDVGDPAQVGAFTSWLASDVSSTVDVLVNNAGGSGSVDADATLDQAALYASEMLSTNLVGAYLMVRALRPHLRRPGGRIVNISSVAAFRGGGDMYSAAKAGLVGLSYSLAQELGPEGITVNVVAPGLVLDTEFFGDRMTGERRRRTVAQIPVGRAGRPEDVAEAVRYLASAAASFVTGEVLHVNGGWVFGR
jgi:3-oxoacyl-[acyl-carrier protein] reductase